MPSSGALTTGAITAIRLFNADTEPMVWPWLRLSAALETRLWITAEAPPPKMLPITMITNIIQPCVAAPKAK